MSFVFQDSVETLVLLHTLSRPHTTHFSHRALNILELSFYSVNPNFSILQINEKQINIKYV